MCDEFYKYKVADINECLEDTDGCDDNAYCINTHGSFGCDNCKPGYLDVSGDGKICQGEFSMDIVCKYRYNHLMSGGPTWL